jgi:ferredoxin
MKIRAHPGICEGHGLCRRFAPSVYQLDDEGYIDLHMVEVPPELEEAAEIGASVCPAGAITIIRTTERTNT